MRTHIPKLMLIGLGGGIAAYMFSRRGSQARIGRVAKSDPMAADPADPVQGFDELNPLHLDELDVDAMSHVDAEADVDSASREVAMDLATLELDAPQVEGEVGDLYGVPASRAQDRLLPDDDVAMAEGQNWVEALETSAAENGPLPETSLDAIVDDEDLYGMPPADADDLPVADRGSGGPAGI